MASKKRVLILSADAGFGHKSASKAIAAAFAEAYADEVECEISNPLDSDKAPAWLRDTQNDYDRLSRDMPELYKLQYDLSDLAITRHAVENALKVLLYRAMKDAVVSFRPDVIINTYPLYSAPLATVFSMARESVPTMNVVTDLSSVHQMWFSREVDLTIVPTETVWSLAIAAGLEPSKVAIIGIPVHPRIAASEGGADKAARRAGLGLAPDLLTLLAVGSKRVTKLLPALDILNHAGLPIQVIAVAGGDEVLAEKLRTTEWHLPARVYDFVSDMPSLMRASDAVLSKAGGLIVSESLAAGLPLLLIEAIPGQETGNVDHVVKGGAGDFVPEPLDLLKAVRHWLLEDGRLVRERTRAAVALGKPRAAFDVAARALKLVESGEAHPAPESAEGIRELFARYREPLDD